MGRIRGIAPGCEAVGKNTLFRLCVDPDLASGKAVALLVPVACPVLAGG